jgi:hypothetical protein
MRQKSFWHVLHRTIRNHLKETRHEHAKIYRRGRALSDEPAVRDRCASEYIIRVTHAIEHARC